MTTVVDVRESPAGGYQVETVHTGRWVRKQHRTWSADQVVFSAAALGTQNLLHRLLANGSLPRISARLGELARTNSEVTLIATSRTRTDLAQGVAGTSSIHPDANTHIEAFRIGKGGNWGYLLTTTLVDGDQHRLAKWGLTNLRHPTAFARSFNARRASEQINLAACDAGFEQFADHLPQARPFRHEDERPDRAGAHPIRTGIRSPTT